MVNDLTVFYIFLLLRFDSVAASATVTIDEEYQQQQQQQQRGKQEEYKNILCTNQ
jgi:hypothetical protein